MLLLQADHIEEKPIIESKLPYSRVILIDLKIGKTSLLWLPSNFVRYRCKPGR